MALPVSPGWDERPDIGKGRVSKKKYKGVQYARRRVINDHNNCMWIKFQGLDFAHKAYASPLPNREA